MPGYFHKNIWENHVLITIVIVFLAFLLFEIKSVLISVFLAYILAATLSPAIEFLSLKKLPHSLSVLLVYFIFLAGLTFIIIPLVPFTVSQSQSFFDNFPYYLGRVSQSLNLTTNIDLSAFAKSEIDILGKNAFFLTSKAFSGLFSLVTIIVVSIYLLLDRANFQKAVVSLFKTDSQSAAQKTLQTLDARLGAWVRGQLTLSFAVGLLSWLGLKILDVPYALPLAIIAGILEMIPLIGPIVSAVPAVIVAITISPTLGLLVVALYTLVQLLENNLLVPKVMQRAVGLNPVAVILGITIGSKLLGIIGAILAIPIILVLITLRQSFSQEEN